jgi:hypothetical protein
MEVSQNMGTPKSSIFIGCSITIQLLGYPHFWKFPDRKNGLFGGFNYMSYLHSLKVDDPQPANKGVQSTIVTVKEVSNTKQELEL